MTQDSDRSDARALKDLEKLLREPPDGEKPGVHMVAEMDGKPAYQWLLTSPDLAVTFAGIVLERLEKLRRLADSAGEGPLEVRSFRMLDVALPHRVDYLELDEEVAAPLRPWVDPLLTGGPHPNFDAEDKDFVGGLRFYVISVGDLHAFRACSPKMQLDRSLKFVITAGSRGTYDRLGGPALVFDHGVDALLWKDRLYVLHRQPFQQMFRFFDVLQQKVDETLDVLESAVPMDDFEAFRADATGAAKALKIDSIRRGPLGSGEVALDWDRVEEVIEAFGLSIRVARGADGNGSFLYDAANQWELYHLLGDDYLVSHMTRNGYEAEAKRRLELRRQIETRLVPELPPAAPRKPAQRGAPPAAAGADEKQAEGA